MRSPLAGATGTGELATSELAAFITLRALITVRHDDGLDIGAVVRYCVPPSESTACATW